MNPDTEKITAHAEILPEIAAACVEEAVEILGDAIYAAFQNAHNTLGVAGAERAQKFLAAAHSALQAHIGRNNRQRANNTEDGL